MSGPASRAERFLALHRQEEPLLQPNAWDTCSARILAHLGFQAIATTSSGLAAALGGIDGSVGRDEMLAHGRALSAAVNIPVAADTENGYADDPEGVAETVRLAAATGLAGCSIEDYTGQRGEPIYPLDLSVERVAAAAEVAHDGGLQIVLTARAENHIRGRNDLGDTIRRLQAYQEAGADVLFAPGVTQPDDLAAVLAAVERPLNVLVSPGTPTVAELADLGVARISVGGAFAFGAYAQLVKSASELRDTGTYGFWDDVLAQGSVIAESLRQDRSP